MDIEGELMRILLCDKKTGTFYMLGGQWTAQRESAENFGTSSKAIHFAHENGLKNVDVFWDFDDEEYNVQLPIAA